MALVDQRKLLEDEVVQLHVQNGFVRRNYGNLRRELQRKQGAYRDLELKLMKWKGECERQKREMEVDKARRKEERLTRKEKDRHQTRYHDESMTRERETRGKRRRGGGKGEDKKIYGDERGRKNRLQEVKNSYDSDDEEGQREGEEEEEAEEGGARAAEMGGRNNKRRRRE